MITVLLGALSASAADVDGDGYDGLVDDCDDTDATVNPAALESCDGRDQDCNGAIDEGLPQLDLWEDLDGDRYGDGTTFTGCSAQDGNAGPDSYYIADPVYGSYLVVSGFVTNGDDCNNYNGNISPAAVEICDDLDNDCNDIIDDWIPPIARYLDEDGDGFGAGEPQIGCTGPYVENDDDCDDQDPDVFPGGVEATDGVDNDCNGVVDDVSDDGTDDQGPGGKVEGAGGCGCASSPTGGAAWPFLVLVIAPFRRGAARGR